MFRYRAKIITKIASAIAIVLYYLRGDTHLYLIPVIAATSCGKSRGVMILMVVTLKCLPFKKRYLVKRFCRKRTVTARIKNSKHFDLLSLACPGLSDGVSKPLSFIEGTLNLSTLNLSVYTNYKQFRSVLFKTILNVEGPINLTTCFDDSYVIHRFSGSGNPRIWKY